MMKIIQLKNFVTIYAVVFLLPLFKSLSIYVMIISFLEIYKRKIFPKKIEWRFIFLKN